MSVDPRTMGVRLRTVVAAFVAALVPFLWKPFHMDDPLFLWAARHIVSHPVDFYGFEVNWYGTSMPMSEVMKNPPLTSYYLAAVGQVVGWSEAAMHAAMLVPAAGLVVGTYLLAGQMTRRPGEATLVAAFTPVLLVSSTTVMSDVPMVCAWVWSVWAWVNGLRGPRPWLLALGAGLVAIATLTKYFGVALLPLLAGYAILRERRIWKWAPWLLLPIAILAAYQIATAHLYGRGLLTDAMGYSTEFRGEPRFDVAKLATALAFTGGSLSPILFFAPALWSRRALLGWAVACVTLVLLLGDSAAIGVHPLRDATQVRWGETVQLAVMVVAGTSVLAVSLLDPWSDWAPDSILLAAWVLGTFAFAAWVNWTVNARAVLAAAPALGILIARRLDRRSAAAANPHAWTRWVLVPCAVLALLVTAADDSLARTGREAAARVSADFSGPGRAVWFQGHWGFQYYAELSGMSPIDRRRPAVEVGDVLVSPDDNTNVAPYPAGTARRLGALDVGRLPFVATMSRPLGAGFYADGWGPLPFAFGRVPPERYEMWQAIVPRFQRGGALR